jgi:hypothetical protein
MGLFFIYFFRFFLFQYLAHNAAKSTKAVFKPLSGIEVHYLMLKGVFLHLIIGLKMMSGHLPPSEGGKTDFRLDNSAISQPILMFHIPK